MEWYLDYGIRNLKPNRCHWYQGAAQALNILLCVVSCWVLCFQFEERAICPVSGCSAVVPNVNRHIKRWHPSHQHLLGKYSLLLLQVMENRSFWAHGQREQIESSHIWLLQHVQCYYNSMWTAFRHITFEFQQKDCKMWILEKPEAVIWYFKWGHISVSGCESLDLMLWKFWNI